MSITHSKNLNPLSNLIIGCKSARLAPQTFSTNGDCTFILLNFLITGFCNFSANCWSDKFLFLIPLP